MKRAWEIKREDSKNIFGLCLKMAWEESKVIDSSELKIKDWFEDKMKTELNGGFLIEVNAIEKETEKAYLLNITWGYSSSCERTINKWVPKSVVMTSEEYKEEISKLNESFEKGLLYNKRLAKYAKENKVKGVRSNMRTATLIDKIRNAGLEVLAR